MSGLRVLAVRTVFFLLGRSLQALSHRDPVIRAETASWEEGFTLMIRAEPRGPFLVITKSAGRLRHLPSRETPAADLIISIKSLNLACRIFTTRLPFFRAYIEHRIGMHGDIARAMSVNRCFNRVQFLLMPGVITRRILKRKPRLRTADMLRRLRLYLLGLPFGR